VCSGDIEGKEDERFMWSSENLSRLKKISNTHAKKDLISDRDEQRFFAEKGTVVSYYVNVSMGGCGLVLG
jgi:hypothetical protein